MDDFHLRPAEHLGLKVWERLSSVRRESGPFLTAVHTGWALLARTYFSLWHRLHVVGKEHLPTQFPFVICSNHSSHLDALALVAPLRFGLRAKTFALAAGDTFFESALTTAFAAGFINALPIWRKKRTPQALKELREKLVNTPCGYVVFPEGGRTEFGKQRQRPAGLLRIEPAQGVANVHDDIVADGDVFHECQRDFLADAGNIDHRLFAGQQCNDAAGQCETHRQGSLNGPADAAARPRPARPTARHRWGGPAAPR